MQPNSIHFLHLYQLRFLASNEVSSKWNQPVCARPEVWSFTTSPFLQKASLAMCFLCLHRSSHVSCLHSPYHTLLFLSVISNIYATASRYSHACRMLFILIPCTSAEGWMWIGTSSERPSFTHPDHQVYLYCISASIKLQKEQCKDSLLRPIEHAPDSRTAIVVVLQSATMRRERERYRDPLPLPLQHTRTQKYTEAAALTYGLIMNSRASAVSVLNVTFAHKSVYFLQQAVRFVFRVLELSMVLTCSL